jgi:hypothetical protein
LLEALGLLGKISEPIAMTATLQSLLAAQRFVLRQAPAGNNLMLMLISDSLMTDFPTKAVGDVVWLGFDVY